MENKRANTKRSGKFKWKLSVLVSVEYVTQNRLNKETKKNKSS